MLENPIDKEFESYVKNFGKREFFLAWFKYCVVEHDPQQRNVFVLPMNYGDNVIIPSDQDTKDNFLKKVRDSKFSQVDIQIFYLYIKSMIIPENLLSFIDNKNIRLINWLLLDTKNFQYNNIQSPLINIPTTHKEYYIELLNFIQKKALLYSGFNNIQIVLPNTSDIYNFSIQWKKPNPSIIFSEENYYDKLIIKYDLLEVDMNTKLTQLHKSVQNYENFKTQDNEISWLTRDDEQQITWAMNYIAKCGLYSIDESFKGITPYDKLLLILDSYCREQTIYRTVFIEKMRKSWTQYKYRSAGKTKKNYHIPLTKSSKEKLSKLSDLMNISENKLLEKLINEKYESLATDHHGNFKF